MRCRRAYPLRRRFRSFLIGSGVPAFAPDTLPGYQQGSDALDAYTDTGLTTPALLNTATVKGLADLSGNARPFTWPGSGGFPTLGVWNGKRGVLFDARVQTDTLTTPSFLGASFNTSLTLYFAAETSRRQVLHVAYAANGTNLFLGMDTSSQTQRLDLFTSGNGDRYTNWAADSRCIIVLRCDGATKRVRIVPANGAADVTGSSALTASLALSGPLILGDILAGSFGWTGIFYGHHFYDEVHDDDQVDEMVEYLLARHFADPAETTGTTGAGSVNVVCDGDSRTSGDGGGTPYPTQLDTLLGAGWDVTNVGVGGQTAGEMVIDADATLDVALYSATASTNAVVEWGGTNDLYFGMSAAQTFNRIRDYVLRRLANGWQKVYVLTVVKRNDAGTPAGYETARGLLNTSLATLASSRIEIVDVGAHASLQDTTNPVFFNADQVHLTTAGYAVVATMVHSALTT